jgi:ABC-type thiamin/hydroxymethylpyrimidine transport system permease subunit
MINTFKSSLIRFILKVVSYTSQILIFLLAVNIVVLLSILVFTLVLIKTLVDYLDQITKDKNVSFTRTPRSED